MRQSRFLQLLVTVGVALVTLACTTGPAGELNVRDPTATTGDPSTAEPTVTADEPSIEEPAGTAERQTTPTATQPTADRPPAGAERQFSTDFSKHSVPYDEILSGGPPKDGIPAIDEPKFVSVEEADEWLDDREPVIRFQVEDDVRAYPLQILMWHEIVNDTVGGKPVTITFCPLCNTAIAFDRTVDGQVLDFGTTGRLRFSNLIMYDRQTETWWQQASGEAIVGEMTGEQLEFLPAPIIAWEDFKAENPSGTVLSRDTGYSRRYGQNPYAGYDSIDSRPFLYQGPPPDGQLPPMARVLTVDLDGDAVAYPYQTLQEERVINDTVGGEPVVVFWQPGTASALNTSNIAEGRDVGAADIFSRVLDDRTLTFSYDGDKIVDDQTGSEWNVLGQAVRGEIAGAQLERIVSINHFWFSWAAFRPETRIYGAES